uniref:Uncharacterized protein n=1 Tax=Oryza glumipatula TaxID=40148 RepID=A0A0D9ZA31_9ORYZ
MAATCTAAWTRAPRQEQAAEIPIVLFPSVPWRSSLVLERWAAVSATARVKFSKDEEIGGSHSAQEILQLAKDDEIKLGGRWKSLDTSAASKIQEVNWRVSQYNGRNTKLLNFWPLHRLQYCATEEEELISS